MKVGLYLGNLAETIGGGATFQREVFTALTDIAEISSHDFYILGGRPSWAQELSYPQNMKNLSFHKVYPSYFARQMLRRLDYYLSKLHLRSPQGVHTFVETHTKTKMDIIVNLSPCSSFLSDIPKIELVWDLQHRLQPFFPEVSSQPHGEWKRRDQTYKKILQRAAYVIAGTEIGSSEIQLFYSVHKDRIRILPHPTPNFCLDSAIQEDHDFLTQNQLTSHKYFLYPAQFWPHKNHVAILRAFSRLPSNLQNEYKIVFVGSDKGNLTHIQRVVEELGLANSTRFLGFVSQEKLALLYKEASLLLYLSLFGPENLPPLEAFGFGCPVIASNVNGAKEQLGEAALLVNPCDPQEISSAIEKVIHNGTLRSQLIERGTIRAKSFTSHDFAMKLIGILDEYVSYANCF